MRKILSVFSLAVLLQSIAIAGWAQQPLDPIQEVLEAGLMTRYPDGQFHPERGIVRAELAAIVVKTFELDKRIPTKNSSSNIPDVPASHWAANDIEIVLETEIMSRDRNGMFYPDRPVTRAEGFAIFAQAFGVFLLNDADVNRILASHPDGDRTPDWARQALATAIFEDLVNVGNNGSLYPLEPMSRADMAYALSQYLAKSQNPGTIPDIPQ